MKREDIYKKILSEFEAKRIKAENEQELRLQKLYSELPELKTIDDRNPSCRTIL